VVLPKLLSMENMLSLLKANVLYGANICIEGYADGAARKKMETQRRNSLLFPRECLGPWPHGQRTVARGQWDSSPVDTVEGSCSGGNYRICSQCESQTGSIFESFPDSLGKPAEEARNIPSYVAGLKRFSAM
jgi:hypothetical protein